MEATAVQTGEQRKATRFTRDGRLTCQYGSTNFAEAAWQDVSADGGCVRLDRYLAPGTKLMLNCGAFLPELKCKVLWCRQAPLGWSFEAGLQFYHTDVEVAAAVTALVLSAIESNEECLIEA